MCGEDSLDRVGFVLASHCCCCQFDLFCQSSLFSSSGGRPFLSRLFVFVFGFSEFGGPNSFVVGEDLTSPFPRLVSFTCFRVGESVFYRVLWI